MPAARQTDAEFAAELSRAPRRVPLPPSNSTAAAILRAGEKARSATDANTPAPTGTVAQIINAGKRRRAEIS